jgi:pimeloyl-ACP methyl ester carboxylesterase
MLKKSLVTLVTATGIALVASSLASAQSDATTPRTGYASVNGLEMYYEITGSGQPLILLHGGLGASEMFAALVPALAQSRQVITVDLQAHGRTADIDRPLTFAALADDVAALVDELELGQVDLLGYSLGGGVALQTAIRHPEVVRKLVLVSTPFRYDGWYPEVQQGMASMSAESASFMLETPMYQLYSSVAPRVEDWPTLVGKLGTLLSTDYDWTTEVDALTLPTLIVVGDADSVRLSHAVEMFGLFGGGQVDGGLSGMPGAQFAVLPNTVHWNIVMRDDLLPPIVVPFLDAPPPEAQ